MKMEPGINTRKRERESFFRFITATVVLLMMVAIIPGVMGTSTVDLGSACGFSILAKTGISTTGGSTINGDIGVSPIDATAITGFGLTMDPSGLYSTSSQVNGKVYAADYSPPTPSVMTSAVSAMEAAYTDGAGRLPTSASFVDVGAGNIGGMNLIPGVYKWSTGVLIPTDVTLSGGPNDVWIFVIPGTLDLSSGKQVILSGGAQPQNIFWVVAGTTTLEPDSTFNGNILDQTLIRLQTRAILNGKALAQTADTLDTTTVNGPSVCTIPGSITLTPATATNTLGQTHTVTATVKDTNGNLVVGKQVTFVVTAGPDTGTTVTSVTDVNGQTTFTYVGNVAGTDHIIASFVDTTGATILSNEVTKTWEQGIPVPEFPIIVLPLGMLLGLVFIITSSRRRK